MSNGKFEDYVLDFEYRLPSGGASGVFPRALPGEPVNGRNFLEVQLLDDADPKFQNLPAKEKTGSLFAIHAPDPVPEAPANQWNQMRIAVQGRKLAIDVNGQRVLSENVDDLQAGSRSFPNESGHIGFQHYRTKVEFRQIRIRALPESSDGETQPASDRTETPAFARAPFSAPEAAALQAEWAEHLGVPVEFENSLGMKFRLIPHDASACGLTIHCSGSDSA